MSDVLFEIRPMSPELYRERTRRIAIGIAVLFIALAMLFATASVQLFGTPVATTSAGTWLAYWPGWR